MTRALHHECERCGQIAIIERAGRFRDADYHELLQEYFDIEAELAALRREHARLQLLAGNTQTALGHARYAIECDLLPDSVG